MMIDFIGYFSTAMCLYAYIMLVLNKLEFTDSYYLWLNLLSSCGLFTYFIVNHDYPLMFTEIVWSITTILTMMKVLPRNRHKHK